MFALRGLGFAVWHHGFLFIVEGLAAGDEVPAMAQPVLSILLKVNNVAFPTLAAGDAELEPAKGLDHDSHPISRDFFGWL